MSAQNFHFTCMAGELPALLLEEGLCLKYCPALHGAQGDSEARFEVLQSMRRLFEAIPKQWIVTCSALWGSPNPLAVSWKQFEHKNTRGFVRFAYREEWVGGEVVPAFDSAQRRAVISANKAEKLEKLKADLAPSASS